jgi:2-keto-4-pentenoate hydratase/2-oxohepta-3-ene-1,7-dioic acid hydratase in catechol pathway
MGTGTEVVKRYVRFEFGQEVAYGLLEGDHVRKLEGDLFGENRPGSACYPSDEIQLLCPSQPSQVFAVGLNYKSHLGERPAPKRPEIFLKPASCLQRPGGPIRIPAGAADVHYEGEMVLVIGKTARNLTVEEARQVVFGVTCGNDVSERQWQMGPDADLQWWRAKGCDTFGPMGPAIATGVPINSLILRTRLNGRVVQQQSTSDLLFDAGQIVSWISKHVTLEPGDVVFTGTPGSTQTMKPGDVIEVEIDGVGVLRNEVEEAA